jgi:hypothetical protein
MKTKGPRRRMKGVRHAACPHLSFGNAALGRGGGARAIRPPRRSTPRRSALGYDALDDIAPMR